MPVPCSRLRLRYARCRSAEVSLAGTRHWQVGQIEPALGATVTAGVTDADTEALDGVTGGATAQSSRRMRSTKCVASGCAFDGVVGGVTALASRRMRGTKPLRRSAWGP